MKRLRAIQLRIGGATFEQIANTPIDPENGDNRPMYTSRQMAHKAVSDALRETARETAEAGAELAALELQRLDSMHVSLWPGARPSRAVTCTHCNATMWREPDLGAVGRLLEISKRRSALLGIDAADLNDERMVALLEEQTALTRTAVSAAMEKAGVPADKQREVMQHAAAFLREAEAQAQ